MSNKNKDVFWSVVFVGFTIIVVVCSVAATLDNKINMLNAMEQAVLNNVIPHTSRLGEPAKKQ